MTPTELLDRAEKLLEEYGDLLARSVIFPQSFRHKQAAAIDAWKRDKRQVEEHLHWRPISELHEDYGDCVLINLADPGHMMVGSNLDVGFDESRWTHFSHIVPLSHEEAEALSKAEGGK